MKACNECDWIGQDDECVNLGRIADLCPDCKKTTCDIDEYGNRDGEIKYCCFPDCGCDGARLCMAEEGASSASYSINIESGSIKPFRPTSNTDS